MSKKLAGFSNRNSLVRNLLLFFLLATVFLSSCVNSKEASTADKTPTTTKTNPTPTSTKTPEITLKAEKTLETDNTPTITPTSIDEMGYYFNFRIITQDAANITTHEPPNNKYLYKYANVSFLIPFREATAIRMNLDNLEDNSFKDSDIVIYKTTGSGGTFVDFYPINGATYYFSDLHGMSYDSCMEHFPFSNMDPDIYNDQSWKTTSQRDFCVLTSDGRLSILRYVQDTYIPKDWGHVYLELVVTTYNQIVPEVLTP